MLRLVMLLLYLVGASTTPPSSDGGGVRPERIGRLFLRGEGIRASPNILYPPPHRGAVLGQAAVTKDDGELGPAAAGAGGDAVAPQARDTTSGLSAPPGSARGLIKRVLSWAP
jgi:hypothetical protein